MSKFQIEYVSSSKKGHLYCYAESKKEAEEKFNSLIISGTRNIHPKFLYGKTVAKIISEVQEV